MRARDRKAVRFGLISAVIFAVLQFGMLPLKRSYDARLTDSVRERRLLAEELGLIEWSTTAPFMADTLRARLVAYTARLFQGVDLNLIGSEVDDYMRVASVQAPLRLTRLLVAVDSAAAAGVHRVNVQMTGRSDFEGVLEFLTHLERGQRLIHVRKLELRAVATEFPGHAETDVEATITAYALSPDDEYSWARVAARAQLAAASATSEKRE